MKRKKAGVWILAIALFTLHFFCRNIAHASFDEITYQPEFRISLLDR